MIFRRAAPRSSPAPTLAPTLAATPPNDDPPASLAEAAWPFNTDSPQIAGVLRADRFLSVMLVDVTGLDWEGITGCLPMIREVAQAKEMVPVLIVDLSDYSGLVAENLAYDTMPNAAANAPLEPALDWEGYRAVRRRNLREKWRPKVVAVFGTAPEWGDA